MRDGRETGYLKDQPHHIRQGHLFRRGKTGRQGILGREEVQEEVIPDYFLKNCFFSPVSD